MTALAEWRERFQQKVEQAKEVDLEQLIGLSHWSALHRVSTSHGGEYAGPCPICGGRDRFHAQPAERRWFCSHCTGRQWQDTIEFVRLEQGLGFREAVEHLVGPADRPVARRRRPLPPPQPLPAITKRSHGWKRRAAQYVEEYEACPDRARLWQAHKPLTVETIERFRLGVGALPEYSSRCRHRRLVLPIVEGGRIVGLRGRAFECDCDKWLPAAGSAVTLFGLDQLHPDATVYVVENNVDAMLAMQETPYCAVSSTSGVSVWRDEWTEALVAVRPELVVVAYDNDLAGQAAGPLRRRLIDAWREEWQARNPGKRVPPSPVANGPKVVNRLLAAGLPAVLWEWPAEAPAKADVGWLLSEYLARR